MLHFCSILSVNDILPMFNICNNKTIRTHLSIIIMCCQFITPNRFQSSHLRDHIWRPCEERHGRHSVRLRPAFRLGFRRGARRYSDDVRCRFGERSTVYPPEGTAKCLRGSSVGRSVRVKKLLRDTIPGRKIM